MVLAEVTFSCSITTIGKPRDSHVVPTIIYFINDRKLHKRSKRLSMRSNALKKLTILHNIAITEVM